MLIISLSSCVVIENKFSALPPGVWRAELNLSKPGDNLDENYRKRFERDNILPFLFEVVYDSRDSFHIEIINGPERIIVDDISFGHNRANGRDSLLMKFPEFNSHILAYFEEDVIEGRFYKPYRNNYSIPFVARHGNDNRFDHVEKDQGWNVSGTWSVTFGIEDTTSQYPAVGEFVQDDSTDLVTGTFMTETGDYRFLSGKLIGEHLWLSCFDGSHAFLFKSKLSDADHMTGFFKSGNHFETLWSGKRDADAQLIDPDSLTSVTDREFKVNVTDRQGNNLDLSQGQWQGKAKVIQIMGTWCPNCKDETIFLSEFYRNKPEGIEILSLAFERPKSRQEAYRVIDGYVDKMNVPYDVYWGGSSSKEEASKAFPSLSGVLAFPTLIFLDQENRIVRVHTGFNGPATSKYDDFVESFNETIKTLTSNE